MLEKLFGDQRVSYRRLLAFLAVLACGTGLEVNQGLSWEWITMAFGITAVYVSNDTAEKVAKQIMDRGFNK